MISLKNRFVLLFIAIFIFSLAGVMSKMAAESGLGIKLIVFMGLQIMILSIYALLWQQILKKFALITAMSCRGLVIILSLVWAAVIFGETVTVLNIIGSLVIVLGIYVVSSEDRKA